MVNLPLCRSFGTVSKLLVGLDLTETINLIMTDVETRLGALVDAEVR